MPDVIATLPRPGLTDEVFRLLDRPAAQQPLWPVDPSPVVSRLAARDPLVGVPEVDRLRRELAAVAAGAALVLTGGDCAEVFTPAAVSEVPATVTTLAGMADRLSAGSGLPVVVVGRVAGQYAKPRSADVDASGLPVYRGDAVNGASPTARERQADPARMLRAFDDAQWRLSLARAASAAAGRGPFFVGHEALLLDYERALVRRQPDGRRYGLSGHFLWVGERTRQLDAAHVALAAMIANPVGLKLGPTVTPAELAEYVERLDPLAETGRLTLLPRLGHARVHDLLPPLVDAVSATGRRVVWQCDPMHGNTRVTAGGRKTRDVAEIVAEVRGFVEVLRAAGAHPGGVHLEMTGQDVTECVGGPARLGELDLERRYESACDPRLNPAQCDDVAAQLAESFGRTVRRGS